MNCLELWEHNKTNLANQTGLLREWRIYEFSKGMNSQLSVSDHSLNHSNVLVTAETPGDLTLLAEFTEPNTGLNAIAYKDISILQNLDRGLTDSGLTLYINL